MRLFLAALLLLIALPANACNITITMTTITPSLNLSKTWTDTDANCVLALTAIQAQANDFGATINTPGQAALWWGQSAINSLIAITRRYQQQQQSVTPINPQ